MTSVSTTGSTTSTAATSTSSTTATIGATSLTGNSVDGLVSGLDTTDIINKLMTIAAQPQTDLKTKLTNNQAVETAYKAIQTDVDALQTAAQKITTPSTWAATTASSSDPSVSATASGTATPGSMTFSVTALASGQADITSEVASTATAIASGPLTITSTATGKAVTITPSDNSMASVASAINAQANTTGVHASIVQTGASAYRLQLSSTSTGAAAAYTVGGLTTSNISAAQNAQLTVGTGANAYTVTSATNTVTGLMAGTSIKLGSLTPAGGSVTVTVADDVTSHAAAVKSLVDAANTLLTDIATDTAYDTSTNTGAVLNGNATMRQLAQNVLSSVSSGVAGGTLATLGVSLTKDGQLSFDSSAFTTAYSADPSGVTAKLTGSGNFTAAPGISDTVSVLTGGTSTSPLAVKITQAATQSTGSFDTSSISAGQVFTVTASGKSASVTAQDGWSASDLRSALTAAASTAGLGISTSVNSDGSLRVTSSAYGDSALTLGVADGSGTTLATPAVTAGLDVQGTVNGVAVTGTGQLLIAPYGTTGSVSGLSIRVVGSDTGNLGTVTWNSGFAQSLGLVSSAAVDPLTGTLTTDLASYSSQDTDLQTRISDWDTQLATQRTALQTQYADLETALGKLKDESSWLASQISSLPTTS